MYTAAKNRPERVNELFSRNKGWGNGIFANVMYTQINIQRFHLTSGHSIPFHSFFPNINENKVMNRNEILLYTYYLTCLHTLAGYLNVRFSVYLHIKLLEQINEMEGNK